jgi:subtilisin family serine protease
MISMTTFQSVIFVGFLLLFSLTLRAQDKYWIFFSDKATFNADQAFVSPQTQYNRTLLGFPILQYTDLPVNSDYLLALQKRNVDIVVVSKWLNAVSAIVRPEQLAEICNLNFVQWVLPVQSSYLCAIDIPIDEEQWQYPYKQVNGNAFAEANLTGKNVSIGIIDGGFLNAHKNPALAHVIKSNRVKAVFDFVNQSNKDLFSNSKEFFNEHGTYVWQLIAGRDSGKLYGLATQATYYLARTEDSHRETKGEEDFWVRGLEWLDSLGVRLVNTSIGYSAGFDNPKDNYKPAQMNGFTAVVSKAAQIAAEQKAMIIVTAAGNEGNNAGWKVLTAPADAPSLITVGATDNYGRKVAISSIGPSALSYVKPDVVCFAVGGGTSASTPVITGIIACMLEMNPRLSVKEVQDILHRSSHIYPHANNYIGYGVPNALKVLQLLKSSNEGKNRGVVLKPKSKSITLMADVYDLETITIYHKQDTKTVLSQKALIKSFDKVVISKIENAAFTTVVLRDQVIEIIWP